MLSRPAMIRLLKAMIADEAAVLTLTEACCKSDKELGALVLRHFLALPDLERRRVLGAARELVREAA